MRTKQLSMMSSLPLLGVEILRADEGNEDRAAEEVYHLTGAKTPYSYYFARRPSWQSPGKGASVVPSSPKETRPRLRKRRTIDDVAVAATATTTTTTTTTTAITHRLRQQKEHLAPRPSTYIDVTANMKQLKTDSERAERIRRPLAKSAASMSTTSVLLPNLNHNSLWLNRKAQAKPPVISAVPMQTSSLPRGDLERQSSASSTATFVRPLPPIPTSPPPLPPSHPPAAAASKPAHIPPLLVIKKSTRKSKRMSSMSKTTSIYSHNNYNKDTLTVPSSFSNRNSNRRSRPRPISVATTMSLYSQKSFPHHLQLPSPTHSYAHSEGLQWFVGGDSSDSDSDGDAVQLEYELEARCADDYYGYGSSIYPALGPRIAERPLSAMSEGQSTARSLSRARSYGSVDTVRKSFGGRETRRERHSPRRRPWSGSASVVSASTFGSGKASLPGWARNDISEVQEEMKSFLDMSEDSRWWSASDLEPPAETATTETPTPAELVPSLASGSRTNSYSSSGSGSRENINGSVSAGTSSRRERSAYRESTILPRTRSPSPNPTMAYVVVLGNEEKGESTPPLSASTTVVSASTSTSAEGHSSTAYSHSTMTSYLYSHSGMNGNGREGSVLCGDYDYGFAVNVLLHDPEYEKGKERGVGVERLMEKYEDEEEKEKENRKPGPRSESVRSRAQRREEFVYHGGMQPMRRRVSKKASARSLRKNFALGKNVPVGANGNPKAGSGRKRRRLCSKKRGSVDLRDGRRDSGEKRGGRKEKERRSLFLQVANFFGRSSSLRVVDSGMR